MCEDNTKEVTRLTKKLFFLLCRTLYFPPHATASATTLLAVLPGRDTGQALVIAAEV